VALGSHFTRLVVVTGLGQISIEWWRYTADSDPNHHEAFINQGPPGRFYDQAGCSGVSFNDLQIARYVFDYERRPVVAAVLVQLYVPRWAVITCDLILAVLLAIVLRPLLRRAIRRALAHTGGEGAE